MEDLFHVPEKYLGKFKSNLNLYLLITVYNNHFQSAFVNYLFLFLSSNFKFIEIENKINTIEYSMLIINKNGFGVLEKNLS